MKVKKIYYTPHFVRAFKKLPRRQKEQIDQRLEIFRRNPYDPRLKTHKLKGKLKGLLSFSITGKHQIVFEFLEKDEVVFHDAGGHRVYQ